jgi:N-acetylmuramoyl-L-alanine amidase
VRTLSVTLALLLALAPFLRSQDAPASRVRTVVIDPGHGGEDIGARGANGAQEKQLALEVALRLRTLIETQLSLRVVMTREDDRAVEPDRRAAIANNGKGDVLLSLHANTSPATTLSGAEVYYSAFDGGPSEAQPAALVTLIPWNDAQARYFDTSARLAGIVHAELGRFVPMSARSIRQAPLRALSGAAMPAVLVEMIFLTNPEQEKAAATHEFKDRLAQALSEAVSRFRTVMEAQP